MSRSEWCVVAKSQDCIYYLMRHFQVPVIAVFTKYDQFRRNVEMDVSDYPDKYLDSDASQVTERRFQEHYLDPLGDDIKYVRLESVLRFIRQDHILTLLWQRCTRKIAAATILLRRQL